MVIKFIPLEGNLGRRTVSACGGNRRQGRVCGRRDFLDDIAVLVHQLIGDAIRLAVVVAHAVLVHGGLQAVTVGKCILADAGHALGNGDAFQTVAAIKSMSTDALKAFMQFYRCQALAI